MGYPDHAANTVVENMCIKNFYIHISCIFIGFMLVIIKEVVSRSFRGLKWRVVLLLGLC